MLFTKTTTSTRPSSLFLFSLFPTQTAGAYPSFISMKHLGVLLPPPPPLTPGRDANPSQGYSPPSSSRSSVPIYKPETGWRETKSSKAPCLRKQREGRGLNPGPPDPVFEVLTTRPKNGGKMSLSVGFKVTELSLIGCESWPFIGGVFWDSLSVSGWNLARRKLYL